MFLSFLIYLGNFVQEFKITTSLINVQNKTFNNLHLQMSLQKILQYFSVIVYVWKCFSESERVFIRRMLFHFSTFYFSFPSKPFRDKIHHWIILKHLLLPKERTLSVFLRSWKSLKKGCGGCIGGRLRIL